MMFSFSFLLPSQNAKIDGYKMRFSTKSVRFSYFVATVIRSPMPGHCRHCRHPRKPIQQTHNTHRKPKNDPNCSQPSVCIDRQNQFHICIASMKKHNQKYATPRMFHIRRPKEGRIFYIILYFIIILNVLYTDRILLLFLRSQCRILLRLC